MRVMLTVQMDTEKANKAITDRTLPAVLTSVFDRISPEAVYFGSAEGMRTGYIVFDLEDAADIPSVAEPFFQELGAKVTFMPVMNLQDIQTGLRNLDAN
ncbi:hypothetical protein GA0115240_154735 [Streptomyces sp. DvalAA-14]|uniref:DUF3303 family protein n=1 Tax=unclassified Streptomyces TaxID=2593676 RepID=UPI00081B7893|nr:MULTISPECIES: DUF3303 family protein [unclassified Streptomyces]MYS23644.1 hypothetical protein [Streptomyces sp. SID4948]SCE36590.1 hypothetical protein GA0115240_154735 [Streptomyces sp. DvalAA-14]